MKKMAFAKHTIYINIIIFEKMPKHNYQKLLYGHLLYINSLNFLNDYLSV